MRRNREEGKYQVCNRYDSMKSVPEYEKKFSPSLTW